VAQLRERGAEVAEFPHAGGHGIDAGVLPDLRAFLHGGASPRG
jgi:phospholipase/carboxylesterase